MRTCIKAVILPPFCRQIGPSKNYSGSLETLISKVAMSVSRHVPQIDSANFHSLMSLWCHSLTMILDGLKHLRAILIQRQHSYLTILLKNLHNIKTWLLSGVKFHSFQNGGTRLIQLKKGHFDAYYMKDALKYWPEVNTQIANLA